MNSLLEHPSIAGSLKHVSSSSGGEWAGSCPWCGGEDRFRVWPEHPSGAVGGRFLCRGCGRQGDGIAFVRELEGRGYVEACKRLGAMPKDRTRQNVRACPVWTPKPSVLPCDAWTSAAGRFVERCAAALAAGGSGQDYALSRGLTPKTCAALRIGWNAQDAYEDRAAWGLPPEVNPKTGKPRRVWQPKGLVLPTLYNGQVVAVKIRRPAWTPEDTLSKYCAVSGGGKLPMVLAPGKGKPVMVVESELDAILAAQEARDIVTAIALRTAKGRPDSEAHALLTAAPTILVALDADRAGAEGSPWWKSTYPKAVRWPVLDGKDVGDLAATSGLIRAWIEAGLPEPERAVDSMPESSSLAVKSSLRRAVDLAHGEPCPYDAETLARFRESHPHLQCCPRTTPAWWWVYTSACVRCKTPCELQDKNTISETKQ